MNSKLMTAFILCFFLNPALLFCADDKKTAAEERLERRQKVELLGFFLKDPKDAKLPSTPMAVQLYNQAVGYFQKNDYALARQTLKQSMDLDRANPLAYELMGDLDYYEEKLPEAKSNYEIAYNLDPTEALKTKLEKVSGESKVEKKLATYREEHFIIKYQNQEKSYEGFELRELLRNTYLNISRDFAYYFKHQVVVLLYDEKDFKALTKAPHWVGGLYDGKVRMPINRQGFTDADLRALTAHEVTHAFIAGMSGQRAPAWINEGLAQYEENKVKPLDMLVFNAAVKTKTLLPIEQLLSEASVASFKDSLRVSLFYKQSFHLTSYLVTRYGMFNVKKMLAEFAKGRNSDEAIREILKLSTERLEREWKDTFITASPAAV